jgi:hypothetical protein
MIVPPTRIRSINQVQVLAASKLLDSWLSAMCVSFFVKQQEQMLIAIPIPDPDEAMLKLIP